MGSGYKIFWTENALSELQETIDYLDENFSTKELKTLSTELDHTLSLISKSPKLFPKSGPKEIRRVPIKKYNTLYYREVGRNIEILSFFSNRQEPDKKSKI